MSIFQESSNLAEIYNELKQFMTNHGWKDRIPHPRVEHREDLKLSKIPDLDLCANLSPEDKTKIKSLGLQFKKEMIEELVKGIEEGELELTNGKTWISKINKIRTVPELVDWYNIFIEREDPKNAPGQIKKREDKKFEDQRTWLEDNLTLEHKESVLDNYSSFRDQEMRDNFFKELKRNIKFPSKYSDIFRVWRARERLKIDGPVEKTLEAINKAQRKISQALKKI